MAAVDFPRQDFDEFCQAHELEDNERLWEELNTVTGSRALGVLMARADFLLDGHGVEYVSQGEAAAAYVNFGDTYTVTLLLDDTTTPTFRLTSWGDFIEAWENEHIEEDSVEAWAGWGRRQFVGWLVALDPEIQGELDDASGGGGDAEYEAIERLRLSLASAGFHPHYDGSDITFRELSEGLSEISRQDPDALFVAFGLALMAQGHDVGVEPLHPAEVALDALVSEISQGSQERMPAWYYLLLAINPKAARYLGSKPNADKFVQAWMEEPIPDPELPWAPLDEPNYLDFATALDRALTPPVPSAVELTARTPDDGSRLLILGDAIEAGDMDVAIKFLKQKPPPMRERKHGLEGY
jgi:hypothetical protein